MKYYQVFFVMLRILVIIQIALVIFKKQHLSPELKTIIDSILKLSIGAFIIVFFYFNNVGLDAWDVYILQFSGIVIMVDVDYESLLDKLLYTDYKEDLDMENLQIRIKEFYSSTKEIKSLRDEKINGILYLNNYLDKQHFIEFLHN